MSKSSEARELLNSKLLGEILNGMHSRYYVTWCKSKSVDEREKIHGNMVAATMFYQELKNLITAEVADE